jgi:hypothetical protein
MTQHDDDVVEVVGAPHEFSARRIGQGHGAIVKRIGRVVAPAIIVSQRRDRQKGGRRRQAIGAVKDAAQGPSARGRDPIALPLVGPDPTPAQNAGQAVPDIFKNPLWGLGSRRQENSFEAETHDIFLFPSRADSIMGGYPSAISQGLGEASTYQRMTHEHGKEDPDRR